jgi:hypothetical protein
LNYAREINDYLIFADPFGRNWHAARRPPSNNSSISSKEHSGLPVLRSLCEEVPYHAFLNLEILSEAAHANAASYARNPTL